MVLTQRARHLRGRQGKRHARQAGEEGTAHAAAQCARQRHRRGRLGRAGRHRAGRQGGSPRDARPQDGGAADRQGPAGPEIRPDHRLCHRGHRPRQPRAHAQLLVRHLRARLRLRPGCARRGAAAARGARHLRGLPPRQRQGRHAQLHRHPDQRELLGLGGALHGRGRHSLRHPGAVPQRRRRRLLRARHRLRPRRQGRGLRGARAHAVGLCRPSQPVRRAGGGPRLRGVPDRAAEGEVRPDRGRQLPLHDHPGHRRHEEDHRGRRRPHQGDAAAAPTRCAARRSPPAS